MVPKRKKNGGAKEGRMDATARRGWTVRAAVVVSRDGDRIREVTVDNRGEVKVEPESERGRMEEKKGLITRKASSDLEEVCDSSQVGFANPFWPLAGYGHAKFP